MPINRKKPVIPQDAYLVFNQLVFPLTKPIVHIGRESENDLVVKSPGISRMHAQVRFENNEFVLYDLNSSNGTFINQRKIKKGALFSGAIIDLADVTLVFVIDNKGITKNLEMDTGELKNL